LGRAIKKCFKKVDVYYVGPDAMVLMKAGKGLTIGAYSPQEFELRET
jgi:hypothetical protein